MNNGMAEIGQDRSISMPTTSERLENEEKVLTERLDKVRKIRRQLEANPEVQSLIDGLSALGQFHY